MPKKEVGVARYENVGKDYLETRKLKRSAGWILLWALGVGAVISGDFFGWNAGLAAGGFWGLTLAAVIMAVMYACMVFSIAELSAALPHAGGFYSFVRNALGPTSGFICGATDTIEYVITPATIAYAIGSYLDRIFPGVPLWSWWLLAYVFFVAINIRGVELTLQVGLVITLLAVVVLAVFFLSAWATGAFRQDLLFNLQPDEGQSVWLPKGYYGVFSALPFAIWFYLAIEQLPLAAEETHDVVNNMPRALVLGIFTLFVLSLFTLVLNSGVGGGVNQLKDSPAPLADGFKAVLGDGLLTKALTLLAVTGLVASFHTILYAYGRVLFSLSRAGYFPRWISLTNKHHTPHLALILGAVVGFGCTYVISLNEKGAVGAALLYMSVFGAVISYTLVMVSYISLKLFRPELPRPYRSPLGIPGAALGACLSLVALLACFSVEDYRPAVFGVAIFLFVAILYFLLYSRKRLVAQAPEEEVALVIQAEQELLHR
jgi:ethanolamine permease